MTARNLFNQTLPAESKGLGFIQSRLWRDWGNRVFLRYRPRTRCWELWEVPERCDPYCIHAFGRTEQGADSLNSKTWAILHHRIVCEDHARALMDAATAGKRDQEYRKAEAFKDFADVGRMVTSGQHSVTV